MHQGELYVKLPLHACYTPRVFWLEPMFPCAMQLFELGRAGIASTRTSGVAGRWGESVPTATRRAHVAYVRRLGSEPRRSTTWCVEPATRANVGLSTGYEIAHDDSTRFLHSQADGWESDSVSQLDPRVLAVLHPPRTVWQARRERAMAKRRWG